MIDHRRYRDNAGCCGLGPRHPRPSSVFGTSTKTGAYLRLCIS
jgi:hypothetical protein